MNYPVSAVFYRLQKCRVLGFQGDSDSYDSIDGPVFLQQGVMILMFHQMAVTAGQDAEMILRWNQRRTRRRIFIMTKIEYCRIKVFPVRPFFRRRRLTGVRLAFAWSYPKSNEGLLNQKRSKTDRFRNIPCLPANIVLYRRSYAYGK
jgi:hypothetical protein